jgi:Arc/MetJ-type ribon-helix-helix transcriptional regulator
MPKRIKVTITLGQPIVEWLREQVKEGHEPSTGWIIERLVREAMERQKLKPER